MYSFPLERKTLYIMSGLSGSGKSTFIEDYGRGAVIASKDEIRRDFVAKGFKPWSEPLEKRINNVVDNMIQAAMFTEAPIFVDATSLSPQIRARWSKNATDLGGKSIIIWIHTHPIDAIKQMQRRGHNEVPLESWYRMYTYHDVPKPSEGSRVVYLCADNSYRWVEIDYNLAFTQSQHWRGETKNYFRNMWSETNV